MFKMQEKNYKTWNPFIQLERLTTCSVPLFSVAEAPDPTSSFVPHVLRSTEAINLSTILPLERRYIIYSRRYIILLVYFAIGAEVYYI